MYKAVTNIVYLNGEFLPLEQARVPVTDRGFLFADGVYEVIPVYQGKIFHCDLHLQRLQNSLNNIKLALPMSLQNLKTILQELIIHNKTDDGNYAIYLQITRGSAPTRQHVFPDDVKPTLFAQCSALKSVSFEQLQQGGTAITLPDTRWQNCFIKSIALLPNVLMAQAAKEAGANEAILIRDGYVTEGASSNVFVIKNNIIKTPPLATTILGGITRDVILKLLKDQQIKYLEIPIKEQELYEADEIWISSSTREILPIIQLNNQKIGNGKAGSLWEKVIQLFRHYKNTF